MTFWRQAGLNSHSQMFEEEEFPTYCYIQYSAICARVVRRVLKGDFKVDAARREDSIIRTHKWEGGRPIKDAPAVKGIEKSQQQSL